MSDIIVGTPKKEQTAPVVIKPGGSVASAVIIDPPYIAPPPPYNPPVAYVSPLPEPTYSNVDIIVGTPKTPPPPDAVVIPTPSTPIASIPHTEPPTDLTYQLTPNTTRQEEIASQSAPQPTYTVTLNEGTKNETKQTFNDYVEAEQYAIENSPIVLKVTDANGNESLKTFKTPDAAERYRERLQEKYVEEVAAQEKEEEYPNAVAAIVGYGEKIGRDAKEAKLSGDDLLAGALFSGGAAYRFLTGFITGPALLPATVHQVYVGKVTPSQIIQAMIDDPIVTVANVAVLGFGVYDLAKSLSSKSIKLPSFLEEVSTPEFKYAIPLEDRPFFYEARNALKVADSGLDIYGNTPTTSFQAIDAVTPKSSNVLGKVRTFLSYPDEAGINIYGNTPSGGIERIPLNAPSSELLKYSQNLLDNIKNTAKLGDTAVYFEPMPLADNPSQIKLGIKNALKMSGDSVNIYGNTPTTSLQTIPLDTVNSEFLSNLKNYLKIPDDSINIYGNTPTTKLTPIGTNDNPLFSGMGQSIKAGYAVDSGFIDIYGNSPNPSLIDPYLQSKGSFIQISEPTAKSSGIGKIVGVTSDGGKIVESGGQIVTLYPRSSVGQLPNPYYATTLASMMTSNVPLQSPGPMFYESLASVIGVPQVNSKVVASSVASAAPIIERVQPRLPNIIDSVVVVKTLPNAITLTDSQNKVLILVDDALKDIQGYQPKEDIIPEQVPVQEPIQAPIQEPIMEPIQTPDQVQEEKSRAKTMLSLRNGEKVKENKEEHRRESLVGEYKVVFTRRGVKEPLIPGKIVEANNFHEALSKTYPRGSTPRVVEVIRLGRRRRG